MKEQVPANIKKERVHRLLDLSNELWDKYTNKFIGKDLEVLIEKHDEENHVASGHTSNYIDIKFNANNAKPGDIVVVNIPKDMIISK